LTIECSTPEPVNVPRAAANESSSSNTMMLGALWRALRNTWRRFSSDSPTHLLFSSGPLTTMIAAPSAVAIALAKSVLPVPGGPQKIMPRGTSPSIRLIASGSFCSFLFARMSRISDLRRVLTFA